MTSEAYVYDAIRTPRGRGKAGGALHGVKPVDLVVGLIDEVRRRFPGLDPAAVDDIVLGVASPVGDQGADIARTAALAAGLPGLPAGRPLPVPAAVPRGRAPPLRRTAATRRHPRHQRARHAGHS